MSASVPVRAKMGKPTGGRGPFGYMWLDKQLVVNPAEASIVKEIFNTFLSTKKLLTTANVLNEKGYRSRNGAKFGKTTIKRVLTDPTYKGMKRANYSKSKGDKKSWLLKPQDQWVFFEVEPLVSEDVWNEVNTIIRKNAIPFPSSPPPIGKYAFSGLLTCGECNKKMYVMKYDGMKVPRYICRGCRTKINEDILLDQFKEGLKCMVVSPQQLQGLHQADEQQIKDKQNQLKTLNAELKGIEKKIDNLLDLFNDGSLDKKIFSEKIKEQQERKQQLENEIPRLEGEIDFIKTSEIGKDFILTKATTLYALWDTLDNDSKVKIVKELLSGVSLNKKEVIFEYFYLPALMELCKGDQTLRDAVTFAQCPQYRLALLRPKELPKGYPVHVKTIGEHIRKRRLDLGLLQIEVAKMIGVTESTVWNWEHGTEPELRYMPRIIEFLGYVPFECPDDPIEKLRYFKKVKGMTYERLGELMGRDPEQITDWISGRVRPCKKNLNFIQDFLKV